MKKLPHIMEILKAPIVTEKSAGEERRYAFKVVRNATKPLIKKAVEHAFKVQVDRVTTINVAGKVKKRGQVMGKQKDWKKAYVVLAEGQHIDFTTA